jgi:glyoxylase-like metal-dependent hydrolase (beta-lactamase superfamily II)
MILVDCGSSGQEKRVMQIMNRLGRSDLRLILITHAHLDHYGSAAVLRRLTGAPVAIHRADANAMACAQTNVGQARGYGRFIRLILPLAELFLRPEPVEADLLLDGDEDFGFLGLSTRVVPTPGHTPGSVCLWVENRLAFAGDLILTSGRPHVQELYAQDWSLIPSSLARLQALHPQWIYPGHGRLALHGDELQKLRFR